MGREAARRRRGTHADQGPLDPAAARPAPPAAQVPRGREDRQPHLPQLLREVEGEPVQEQEGPHRAAPQSQGREGEDQAARGAVGLEEGEGADSEGEEGREEGGRSDEAGRLGRRGYDEGGRLSGAFVFFCFSRGLLYRRLFFFFAAPRAALVASDTQARS